MKIGRKQYLDLIWHKGYISDIVQVKQNDCAFVLHSYFIVFVKNNLCELEPDIHCTYHRVGDKKANKHVYCFLCWRRKSSACSGYTTLWNNSISNHSYDNHAQNVCFILWIWMYSKLNYVEKLQHKTLIEIWSVRTDAEHADA